MLTGRPDLDFKLSITRALADQLDGALNNCFPAPLVEPEIVKIERRPGVYELLVNGELVYVGKASQNLAVRLAQHARKLAGREGFEAAEIRFICLYVDEDLEASAPEKLLIKRYRAAGQAPWNTNGFGNKDPGRRRDTSAVAIDHFDAQHPINLDYLLRLTPSRSTVANVLVELKAQLPYLLRFANPRTTPAARQAYEAAAVDVPGDGVVTARQALHLVVAALPPSWQATALPGYVILYPENATSYESAIAYFRSTGSGTTEELAGPQRFAPPGAGPETSSDDESDVEPADDE